MSREAEIVEAFQLIAAKQRFFSVEDVNANWHPADYHGATDLSAGGRLATVRAVLRTLEALGKLRREGARLEATTWHWDQVRLASRKPAADGPPDGSPPPPDGGNQRGGQGGDGFREVLSHPHLFAMAPADFDRLLEAI